MASAQGARATCSGEEGTNAAGCPYRGRPEGLQGAIRPGPEVRRHPSEEGHIGEAGQGAGPSRQLGALGLAVVLALAGCSGSPALTSVAPVRAAFDAAAGHPRTVLILSPTCPVCTGVVDALQHQLETHPEADVRVVVVYSRFLRWDRLGLRAATRARLHDSRVTLQVWDPDGVVAASLCAATPSSMCITSPRLFGWVGWWPAGAPWGWPTWTAWDALPALANE
jgi:hypothetical protein